MEGVSETKRAQILQVAKDINYVANANARSLVKASSDLVGVCVPTLYNDVFASMLEGLHRGFARAGILMVVHSNNYERAEEMKWVERLMSWRPAGIVLTGTDHEQRVRQIIRRSGIPAAEIWDISDDPIDFCVGIDHEKAGRAMAQHALTLGYRRPGFVLGSSGHDARADKRFQGALAALHDAGVTEEPMTVNTMRRNNFVWGYTGAMKLCQRQDRPDIIFFVNDHLAIGGLRACEALGIKAPRDIGLVGFNAMDGSAVLSRKLTTYRTLRGSMGRIAAKHLVARLHGVEVPRVTEIKPKFMPGQTTRQQ